MDRATDHLVNEPPANDAVSASPAVVHDDVDVALSKQRLVDAARAFDPLSPLRRHPLITVATAAAIGVVAASPAAARTVSAMVPPGWASRLAGMAFSKLAARRGTTRTPQPMTPPEVKATTP